MKIVASFDPSLKPSDTFNAGFTSGSHRIIVYNESYINLQLSWDSFTTYCPAWTAMLYCINTGNGNIGWKQLSNQPAGSAPTSVVYVELLGQQDPVVGTYPAALVRQANIGNSLNVTSSATSIQNDGNAAGTNSVESTVLVNAFSSFVLTNDGKITIKDGTGAVVFSFNLITLLLSKGLLGVLASGDLIDASASQTVYKARGGDIIFQSPTGTEIARFQNNQVLDLSRGTGLGQLKLLVGTITRISFFSPSVTTTSTGYPHGLGVLPDIVLGINRGTNSTANPLKWNPATSDATNAALVCTVNGVFDCVAIKF
jgi:hypothetical protein